MIKKFPTKLSSEKMVRWMMVIGLYFWFSFAQAGFPTEKDKQLHMAVNAALTMTTYAWCRSNDQSRWTSSLAAIGVSAFLSTLKEITDKEIDSKDLEADGLGIASGLVLSLTFNF